MLPGTAVGQRKMVPVDSEVSFTINQSMAYEELALIYASPWLDLDGWTRSEAFVGFVVIQGPPGPVGSLAFVGNLALSSGSGSCAGTRGVIGTLPGLTDSKGFYRGPGYYSFPLLKNGGSFLDHGVATAARFEFRAGGRVWPEQFRIKLSGVVVAGQSYAESRHR